MTPADIRRLWARELDPATVNAALQAERAALAVLRHFEGLGGIRLLQAMKGEER